MKALLSVLACIFVFSTDAGAFTSDEATVRGRVKSFDQSTIFLETENAIYKVPKKLVLLSEIKSGQTLSVSMSRTEFNSLQVEKRK